MSQLKQLQKRLQSTQAKSRSQQLLLLYAQQLLQNAPKQSAQALTQSLTKVEAIIASSHKLQAVNAAKNQTTYNALQALTNTLNPHSNKQRANNAVANENFIELKAKRVYQAMAQQQAAERIVQQAIEQGPENPGPLNPQQLAITALTQMRNLSPAYLTRYVNYIDSLFSLEQINKQLQKTSKK